jgi:hypothetical protein
MNSAFSHEEPQRFNSHVTHISKMHLRRLVPQDRKRFERLARLGVIPPNSVQAFVELAAAARYVRAITRSDAMALEGIIEISNRPAVESWIDKRYR